MKRGRYERMKDKLSLTHGMGGDMHGVRTWVIKSGYIFAGRGLASALNTPLAKESKRQTRPSERESGFGRHRRPAVW